MKIHPTIELIFVRVFLVIVLILFPAFVIWGSWSIFTNNKSLNAHTSNQTNEIIWIEKSKDSVRLRLKDPNSANFKNVFFSDFSGTPVSCGQVNSKNSVGGYSGYQRYVASGEALVFFENETDDFTKVWRELCRK